MKYLTLALLICNFAFSYDPYQAQANKEKLTENKIEQKRKAASTKENKKNKSLRELIESPEYQSFTGFNTY